MRKHSVIVESKNPLLTGRDVWQNQAKGEAVCYEQFEDEGKEMRMNRAWREHRKFKLQERKDTGLKVHVSLWPGLQ